MRIGLKESGKYYYKRPGSYVIIERDGDNKIAIATDGVFFFLGGGIEKDETKLDGLKREVLEETGYTIKDIKLFDKVSSYCYSEKNGYMDIDATIYTAKFDRKIKEPIELDHTIMWVEPSEYKDKLFHEYQRFILNKYINIKNGTNINRYLYSTTTRCLREKNNLINFENGLKEIEKSKFKYANLNFCEVQELFEQKDFDSLFLEIANNCKLKFNVSHAPMHFPFLFNDYERLAEKDIYEQRIITAIDLSNKLNIDCIVMHIGTTLDDNKNYNKEQSIQDNIKYLDKFVKFAISRNIKIAIENGTNMLKNITPTIDELIEIVDYYNKYYNREILGICFDFGHANVVKSNIVNELKKIGNRLKVIHLHDNYRIDSHNFLFDGNIDWKHIIRTLNEIDYTGELTLEVRYKNDTYNYEIINNTYSLLDRLNNLKFINYAHRGASAYYPENSLISFRKALELNANGIELDLQRTKDNKIVIFHDDIIDKKSNGIGKISDYTYEELLEFDFGSWFDLKYKNEKIMLFDDFAKEFLNKDLTFAIELKVIGIEKEVLEIINTYKTHNNIYISSFIYETLGNIRKLDNKIKISWLIKERINQDNIEKLLRINGTQICPPADLISDEDINLAIKNNLSVRLWGIKNTEIMRKSYQLRNIEGMTVNFPDELYKLLTDSKGDL